MKPKKRKKTRLAKRPRRVHPVKSRRAGSPKAKFNRVNPVKSPKRRISRKAKLFNRARKTHKIVHRRPKVLRKKKPVTKAIKTRVVKKVSRKPQDFTFSTKAIFKPKIRVIGIGGGGSSIVSEIGRSLEKASFVVVDTDVRAMKRKTGLKYFYFGESVTHGLGTGMNPDLAKQAAEQERERIAKLLEGQDIIILIASLGGGLGSGAAPVFAEISRNLNNVTLGIFTLPFRFEGKKKAKISHKAVQDLKEHLNAVITIPNEKIFKIIDEKTSITEAFSLVNKNLIESLESLIDLIYNPGLINIDFADLRTILKGRGMMAFLNTAEASGKSRAEQIVEKVLNNPLFNNNIKAEKILFNISGGNNLSMVEVEKISRSIAELNPKAKIIFGISKNQKAKNRIKTTLLITGPSYVLETPVASAVPIKISKKIVTKHKKNKKKKPSFKIPFVKKPISITINSSPEKTVDKKEMIRRTALEVKKAEEIEEKRRLNQEAEWEIPAFLRRMRFKA